MEKGLDDEGTYVRRAQQPRVFRGLVLRCFSLCRLTSSLFLFPKVLARLFLLFVPPVTESPDLLPISSPNLPMSPILVSRQKSKTTNEHSPATRLRTPDAVPGKSHRFVISSTTSKELQKKADPDIASLCGADGPFKMRLVFARRLVASARIRPRGDSWGRLLYSMYHHPESLCTRAAEGYCVLVDRSL